MGYSMRKQILVCVVLALGGLSQLANEGQVLAANLEMRSKELILASKRVSSPDENVSFTRDCLKFIDEAVADDKLSAAQKIATLAADSANKAGNEQIAYICQRRKAEVTLMVRESRQLTSALKKLSSSPDDPDAHFTIGRFDCVMKDDWDSGTKHLVKCNKPAWKEAAELDLKGSTDNASRLQAGDAWALVAKDERPPFDNRIDLRAHWWYRAVLLQSTGDERTKVQEKMHKLSICYLTDFDESEVKAGPWPLGKYGDRGVDGKIQINGFLYPNGLGLHPPGNGTEALVRFPIGGTYRTLKTGVGLNDHKENFGGTVLFQVFGDGKLLWKSEPFTKMFTAQFAEINVKNVQKLELRTSGGAVGGHAVWLDPILAK